MQKKIELQKLDIHKTSDLIEVVPVLLSNLDKLPSVANFTSQLQSFEIKNIPVSVVDIIKLQCLSVIDNNSIFQNGLYKLIKNQQVVGLFGMKIEEITGGKISHFSLHSFLKPATTQQEKLLMRGIGTEATKMYYDIVLQNTHEFTKGCTFEVQFITNNPYSKGFQKSLGLDKVTTVETLGENISVAKGNIDGFLQSIKNFINLPKL